MTLSLNKPAEGNTDWASAVNDNWTDIENSLPAAKGQLVSGDSAGDPMRLSVGANGTVLTADSAAATGLKWATDVLKDADIGVDVQGYSALLAAIAGLASNGLIARTGAGTAAARSIAAGTGIGVANGDGASADPTVTLDITGLTAQTAPATGDELAIEDVSVPAKRKMTLADALKVINALTADASPDGAADYVVTYDTSAGAAKKVLLDDLPGGGGGGLTDVALQVFPSSGTYTPTTGMTKCLIILVGGGGGGGGASGTNSAGGGGGAGGCAIELVSAATIGSSRTITIGSAGTAGGAGAAGGTGGTSSVSGGILSASGGAGGGGASGSPSIGTAGTSGNGSLGDLNLLGGDGWVGWAAWTGFWSGAEGGHGGSSFFGGGARGPALLGTSSTAAGVAGRAPGSGGSGGCCTTSSVGGGAGAAGACLILEFIE
jgi:hypothetical protein